MARVVAVADDDRDILQLIADVLADEGFEVALTAGRRTLQDVEAHQPDVVLLDYHMPGMDGVQVARSLRQHPRLHNIPIIAMTAAGRASWVCGAMQANGCLGKPFDIEELLHVVHQPRHCAHPEHRG